ncbi:MAG: hypothetical protein U5K43_08115 [Halofilum sp. (in: g-proteobacteria)]|nr:hypothetical protein [Halofilum sp. (in: g-proteobacteria)]
MTAGTPRENLLLGALPEAEYARLSAVLAAVELGAGDGTLAADTADDRVHFPGAGLVSIARAAGGAPRSASPSSAARASSGWGGSRPGRTPGRRA